VIGSGGPVLIDPGVDPDTQPSTKTADCVIHGLCSTTGVLVGQGRASTPDKLTDRAWSTQANTQTLARRLDQPQLRLSQS